MSEKDGTQSSPKQRRNRKTSTAIQLNGNRPLAAQLLANDDKEAWKAYWQAQGQTWRTEPEIDEKRQKYLDERRSITPNLEQGIYPFIGLKLSRADVEWLLATHENGHGPVNWSDEGQHERDGLDLRGADLCQVDLRRLPLANLRSGLTLVEWSEATKEQRDIAVLIANEAYLTEAQGAYLAGAQLQNANFGGAQLQNADFTNAELEGADFGGAELEGAYFTGAQLQKANFAGAQLQGADLSGAKLQKANLSWAQLQRVDLSWAQLQKADLKGAQLQEANLSWAQLQGAHLTEAQLDRTNLADIVLGDTKDIGPQLVDVHWGNTNLSVVDWSQVQKLGDEHLTKQKKDHDGQTKQKNIILREYRDAVRANRQLAVALRDQGLHEEADHFAYRAQRLQCIVLRKQRKYGRYLFSAALDLLAGYGYRPLRSVFWYLVTLLGFALVYSTFGHLSLWPPDAFVYSLTSFHGRGFFPGLEGKPSLHDPLIMFAAFEAVVGLFIEISFIATFTQRFFGK